MELSNGSWSSCFSSAALLRKKTYQLQPPARPVYVPDTKLIKQHRYHEANPLEYDFQPSSTFLIGRGPGLLSAAAISLSPRLSMIPSISEEIARVAFRFGLIVDQVCRSIEVSPDEINAEGAWIYCAHGVDEEAAVQAVDRFNVEKVGSVSGELHGVSIQDTNLYSRHTLKQTRHPYSTWMGSPSASVARHLH